ncbi:HAD family hydrolase, partial [bacterium]|nr:HAD family hydrolase [bacterium]
MAKTTVVLWDIDGTLVTTASAGRRAVDRAFRDLHGFEDATAGVPMAGRTDPWIVDCVLRGRGVEPTLERRRAVLSRYLEHLAGELEPVPAGRPFGPLPGVQAALEALAGREDCLQGLLTGNVLGGARAKLER